MNPRGSGTRGEMVSIAQGAWKVGLRLSRRAESPSRASGWEKTSAWAPKRLPQSLLQFMNKRAPHKVMWASNHPSLPLARCMDELPQLDLRPEVLDAFVYGNAERVLFSARAR